MLTIVAIVLALTVLPSPWGLVAVAGAAVIDVTETVFLLRWNRRRGATVGAETIVGRPGVVVTPIAPRGQVKVDGEIWEARSSTPLARGAEVVVRAVDGLVLEVEEQG